MTQIIGARPKCVEIYGARFVIELAIRDMVTLLRPLKLRKYRHR